VLEHSLPGDLIGLVLLASEIALAHAAVSNSKTTENRHSKENNEHKLHYYE
jgi:hypothetical protein